MMTDNENQPRIPPEGDQPQPQEAASDVTGGWYAEEAFFPAQPAKPLPPAERDLTPDVPVSLNESPATQTQPVRPVVNRQPAIDAQGFPLPRRRQRRDLADTHSLRPARITPDYETPAVQVNITPAPPKQVGVKRGMGCFIRGFIVALFLGVIGALVVGSFGIYQYYRIASGLPDVSDLQSKASQFETTRILDRNGNVLYEILDPNAGRRSYVTLDKISPNLVAAIIATEDKEFYNHPGFDPVALLRALWQNYTAGGITSGASTITQQLARLLLLSPEERFEISVNRKAREIILAAELTRRYSKEEVLELYLNEIYFGNLAYGIEAASETYFGTTAGVLNLSQAAFLAGLPQAPAVYDIYTNRAETLRRHKTVLVLMYKVSQEKNCIFVSNSQKPVCIDAVTTAKAATEMELYNFTPTNFSIRYPHWVYYIRSQLEAMFDPQRIYRSGFTVTTTLDPGLQDEAERIVFEQVAALADRHVSNGALVAIRPSTGEIVAMVGSADFYNVQISGQVNMAVSPTRQPGSVIKPLTYVAAFERGWNPATLLWDVPSQFPPSGRVDDPSEPYQPVNYDGRFHGPVSLRVALANSYNIPAVKALEYIGIYDNPGFPGEDGLVAFSRRLGISSLTRDDYGLSLTLGGGEVSLLEMTGAYAVFANAGNKMPLVSIIKIVDFQGQVVYEYIPPPGDQIVRAEHAYLISSILSDKQARIPMFGVNPIINLSFDAAVKTGTSNDFRDNWTIGYTPDLTVGVWVGNADYTPMDGTTGLTGAAPIWAEFMQHAIQQLTGGSPTPQLRPSSIIDRVVCSLSGTEPSPWCENQRTEIFAAEQPPLPASQDLWMQVEVDTWTGLRTSANCAGFSEEKFVINVTDPWAIKWIMETDDGRNWAEQTGFIQPFYFVPERECREGDSRPNLDFTGPGDGQIIIMSPLEIFGVADAPGDFDYFSLAYGLGDNPNEWIPLLENVHSPISQPGLIYAWDLSTVPSGRITLKLTMHSSRDTFAEKKIRLDLQASTPTPTPTPTPIPTNPVETPAPVGTPGGSSGSGGGSNP